MKQINEYLEKPINESQVYDDIIKSLQESKEQGKPIEEGLFTGLFAGAAAFTVGPTIMKAVANVLGIDLKGPLGSLMTSRLILTAVGAKLGYRVWYPNFYFNFISWTEPSDVHYFKYFNSFKYFVQIAFP